MLDAVFLALYVISLQLAPVKKTASAFLDGDYYFALTFVRSTSFLVEDRKTMDLEYKSLISE